MSYPSGSSTAQKKNLTRPYKHEKDTDQKGEGIKHELHLQKYRNVESGCFPFPICLPKM